MNKYCVMPFVSMRIEDSLNKNSSKVRPCCFYQFDSEKFDGLDDYLKSEFLQNLQNHFLEKDELPPGCSTCAKVEKEGQLSVRQLKNMFFSNIKPVSTQIKEIDLFVSNTCNLTCIMCYPKFSSAIGAEQKKLGLIKEVYNFDETDFILESLSSLPDLSYVTIAGGEFFYHKRHKEILQVIVDKKIENVKITTNGTVFNKKLMDLLSSIPKLEIRFSIDGTNSSYEFVRYPAKWSSVKNNVEKYCLALPTAKFETVLVVQPLTLKSIFDWLDFSNTNNLETHWINILGENLSWSMLTSEEKKSAADFILKNIKNQKLTDHQKVYLMNFARTTLSQISFQKNIRENSIRKLVDLCQSRKIDISSIVKMIDIWPHLLNDIKKYNRQ
jgi:molybdenum cofactor biosynthesis enzyme MoaA